MYSLSYTFVFKKKKKKKEMQESESPAHAISEAESEDTVDRFHESLQELRQLRSQLHKAADCCETTFLNTKQNKVLVENTKEYICRAVVTVVDHLGCVSNNLDYLLFKNNSSSEIELRIGCLKQRLLTCQQYVHKLALTQVRWNPNLPRYSHRYISPPLPDVERSNGGLRESYQTAAAKTTKKQEFKAEGVPLFLYTSAHKPSLARKSPSETDAKKTDHTNSTSVLPVREGLPILSKQQNPPFHFQLNHKLRRKKLKLVRNNDILSLIRRSKRAAELLKGLHLDH
ncbi:hypothetical protein AAG906_009720 [Vitis piasezkii]